MGWGKDALQMRVLAIPKDQEQNQAVPERKFETILKKAAVRRNMFKDISTGVAGSPPDWQYGKGDKRWIY